MLSIILSFTDRHTRLWIVGSSIVKHAFARARKSFEGSQLDVQRFGASLWWQGKSSLRWCLVCGYVRMLLQFEDPPDLLVLHVGGNDLGQVPLGDLRFNILLFLEDLRSLLPHTKFVYSQILPRLHWRYEYNHSAMEKARRRLNSFVASNIIRNNGCYIKYPEITENVGLFHSDGTHLSDFGNDMFNFRLQQGLQTFLSSSVCVSPSAGELGPWLAS